MRRVDGAQPRKPMMTALPARASDGGPSPRGVECPTWTPEDEGDHELDGRNEDESHGS